MGSSKYHILPKTCEDWRQSKVLYRKDDLQYFMENNHRLSMMLYIKKTTVDILDIENGMGVGVVV